MKTNNSYFTVELKKYETDKNGRVSTSYDIHVKLFGAVRYMHKACRHIGSSIFAHPIAAAKTLIKVYRPKCMRKFCNDGL